MRSRKTSQVPGTGHPRNTSDTDPEVVLKERVGHLWDARTTSVGREGQAIEHDKVCGRDRWTSRRGRCGENKVTPIRDVCVILHLWTRTIKQTAGYRFGAQERAGLGTARSESPADVCTGGSHRPSGGCSQGGPTADCNLDHII